MYLDRYSVEKNSKLFMPRKYYLGKYLRKERNLVSFEKSKDHFKKISIVLIPCTSVILVLPCQIDIKSFYKLMVLGTNSVFQISKMKILIITVF